MEQLLENLQSLNESTKRWVLVVGSTLSIALVFVVWLHFFTLNARLAPETEQVAANMPQTENSFTFIQTVRSGGAMVYESFMTLFKNSQENLEKIFGMQDTIIVVPPQ